MLQVVFIHNGNTNYIHDIREIETGKILSSFDGNAKKIDLSPLKDHIGENIMITHLNRTNECIVFDYEHVKTLNDVVMEGNNAGYFTYS